MGIFVFEMISLLAVTLWIRHRKKKNAANKPSPLPEHDQRDLPEYIPPKSVIRN